MKARAFVQTLAVFVGAAAASLLPRVTNSLLTATLCGLIAVAALWKQKPQ